MGTTIIAIPKYWYFIRFYCHKIGGISFAMFAVLYLAAILMELDDETDTIVSAMWMSILKHVFDGVGENKNGNR